MKPEKAIKRDEVFAEMFKLGPKIFERILVGLWKACGSAGIIPKAWNEVDLFPIYKQVERSNPETIDR